MAENNDRDGVVPDDPPTACAETAFPCLFFSSLAITFVFAVSVAFYINYAVALVMLELTYLLTEGDPA